MQNKCMQKQLNNAEVQQFEAKATTQKYISTLQNEKYAAVNSTH